MGVIMLDRKQWMRFINKADTYHGPLTIGELFCSLFDIEDREISRADEDTVWQLIVNKYLKKD